MPDKCDAPHCRKCIKTNEERAWCSLCSRVMHKKCQQHVIKVDDIRICFYCNLSPEVTVKTVEKLRDYFAEKIEEKKRRTEKEKNTGINTDRTANRDDNGTVNKIVKDVKDDIKERKIKTEMRNTANIQETHKGAYKIEQSANLKEKHPRNPFNENDYDNGDDNAITDINTKNPFKANMHENYDDRMGITMKQPGQDQRNALNGNKRLNGNNEMGIKMIDADKLPRNRFNEDSENDDKTKMQIVNKNQGDTFIESLRETDEKLKAEMRKNKELISEFQEDANNHDGKIESAIQKQIQSFNRRAGTASNTQYDSKDSKPRGLQIECKDHDNRFVSNIQDNFKIHDTNKFTKNGAQANQLQEDVLKVLETVNKQNRLLENLVANDNRLEQPKNQNSSCNLT